MDITGPITDVDAALAACEAPRTPDAETYDLGHWELVLLCMILDEGITEDLRRSLSGEGAKMLRQACGVLRQIFTTDGTVSVTVRHAPR